MERSNLVRALAQQFNAGVVTGREDEDDIVVDGRKRAIPENAANESDSRVNHVTPTGIGDTFRLQALTKIRSFSERKFEETDSFPHNERISLKSDSLPKNIYGSNSPCKNSEFSRGKDGTFVKKSGEPMAETSNSNSACDNINPGKSKALWPEKLIRETGSDEPPCHIITNGQISYNHNQETLEKLLPESHKGKISCENSTFQQTEAEHDQLKPEEKFLDIQNVKAFFENTKCLQGKGGSIALKPEAPLGDTDVATSSVQSDDHRSVINSSEAIMTDSTKRENSQQSQLEEEQISHTSEELLGRLEEDESLDQNIKLGHVIEDPNQQNPEESSSDTHFAQSPWKRNQFECAKHDANQFKSEETRTDVQHWKTPWKQNETDQCSKSDHNDTMRECDAEAQNIEPSSEISQHSGDEDEHEGCNGSPAVPPKVVQRDEEGKDSIFRTDLWKTKLKHFFHSTPCVSYSSDTQPIMCEPNGCPFNVKLKHVPFDPRVVNHSEDSSDGDVSTISANSSSATDTSLQALSCQVHSYANQVAHAPITGVDVLRHANPMDSDGTTFGPSADNQFSINPEVLFEMNWSDSSLMLSNESGTESDSDSDDQTPEKPVKCDRMFNIAKELLQTERTYVHRLNILYEVFYSRIWQENRQHCFLPADTLSQIFSDIRSIYHFHNDFLLHDLELRMQCWDTERRIGDLMRKHAPFLKMYTEYVKNYSENMNSIYQLQEKSHKFAALINDIQKMPECEGRSLEAYMVEPIQRVPRYELLLKDYIKCLTLNSLDRQDAQAALHLVTQAACHSNEAIKSTDKIHKLLSIHDKLRGLTVDIISPTREFVREGPVTKISARSGDKQSRYLFLFNDLLLICTGPLVGAYRVREQLDVEGMKIHKGDNMNIPDTFIIHSKQKVIELLDESPKGENTETWFELLLRVVQNYWTCKRLPLTRPPAVPQSISSELPDSLLGKQAPRWVPDDAASMCMMCREAFTTIHRRHHCYACGKLICKCCIKKAPLEYMNRKMGRVCERCYDVIVYGGRTQPIRIMKAQQKTFLQVSANDPCLLAGYLQVSDDEGKTWSKNWFALHDDFVMYFFKARQDVSAYSSLPLPGYSVKLMSDCDWPNVFRVEHNCIKSHLFQADTEDMAKTWVRLMEKLVLAQLPGAESDCFLRTRPVSGRGSSSSESSTKISLLKTLRKSLMRKLFRGYDSS